MPTLTPREVARLRVRAQRVASSTFTEPAQVVRWLGAMQAQDYLGALWAVGLRMTAAVEAGVERALRERSVVRTWPMRGTLHFVAATDVRWMLDLLTARVLSGAAGRFRALSLEPKTFARAERALVRELQGGRQLTRAAAYQALERAGISTAGQRGIHILFRLAHERVLCFGPREGKQHTFVLLDEWLGPAPRQARSREQALGELAARYFTGHGPATPADFAWWAGLTKTEATRAVAVAGRSLEQVDVAGRAHWLAAETDTSAPAPGSYALPAFDELLVAYADRSAALDPRHQEKLNPGGNGILNPVIVVDGQVAATWKRALTRRAVRVTPAFFAPLPRRHAAGVAQALQRYAAFLELSLQRG